MTAFIYRDKTLPIEFCNVLVDKYKDSVQPGEVLDEDKNGRQSSVCFINDGPDRDTILAGVRANTEWLPGISDGLSIGTEIQFSRYDTGDSYASHVDYRFNWNHDKIRKYTVVLNLSPPDAYEGGILVFTVTNEMCPKRQGAAAIFPGFVPHGVSPVVDGTRYSLALWLWGEQWK